MTVASAVTAIGAPTLSRKSELLRARWQHVNFDTGEWLIPEENAKTGKPHVVYMSTQVAAMFHPTAKVQEIVRKTRTIVEHLYGLPRS